MHHLPPPVWRSPSFQVHDGDVIKHGMVDLTRFLKDWALLQEVAGKEGKCVRGLGVGMRGLQGCRAGRLRHAPAGPQKRPCSCIHSSRSFPCRPAATPLQVWQRSAGRGGAVRLRVQRNRARVFGGL